MHSHPPPPTLHTLHRLRQAALLLLRWLVATLHGARVAPRHRRQRGAISLDALAAWVADIVTLTAIERLAAAQHKRRQTQKYAYRRQRFRAHARCGFRQSARLNAMPRSVRGSWLRRRLRHREPLTRLAVLIDALMRFDAVVARMMPRLARGLSRLEPLIVCAPPAHALRTRIAPAPCAADSS